MITGGPGTGKSTVIEDLIDKQFTCMREVSRRVTMEAQKTGIDQLFLKDPLLFSKLLMEGRIDQFQKASENNTDIVFFDRGIPDVFGYLNYLNMDYPDIFIDKSRELRYDAIFMMPPWKDIYITDNERYESYEQSLSIYKELIKAYKELNYDIVTVPEGDISSRVAFILNTLDQ